jgi:hypothetical protein
MLDLVDPVSERRGTIGRGGQADRFAIVIVHEVDLVVVNAVAGAGRAHSERH